MKEWDRNTVEKMMKTEDSYEEELEFPFWFSYVWNVIFMSIFVGVLSHSITVVFLLILLSIIYQVFFIRKWEIVKRTVPLTHLFAIGCFLKIFWKIPSLDIFILFSLIIIPIIIFHGWFVMAVAKTYSSENEEDEDEEDEDEE